MTNHKEHLTIKTSHVIIMAILTFFLGAAIATQGTTQYPSFDTWHSGSAGHINIYCDGGVLND